LNTGIRKGTGLKCSSEPQAPKGDVRRGLEFGKFGV